MADMKIVVVKIGTSTIIGKDTAYDQGFLNSLAAQLAEVRQQGWSPVVVTSGAIGCGLEELGIRERPNDIPSLQAAASVGMGVLMTAYAKAFSHVGMKAAEVLLTRHDTANRSAYLHARDALLRLLELGVVPIVNENDTTSVEQIRIGDNDTLAALVSCLVKAQLCVIFSDVEGLFNGNPADPSSQLVSLVQRITPDVLSVAGGTGTTVGSGGMLTKVKAARVLMIAGIPMVICHGRTADALPRLVAVESIGTRFEAGQVAHEITNYKLWIALGDAVKGSLTIDDGAKRALVERGSSLLAVGVSGVSGSFEAGDIVDINDTDANLVARGKVQASSDEVALAAGLSQTELQNNRVLSHLGAHELIHRDELVVFE